MSDFFSGDMAQSYDAKNAKLAAISDNMHFLIRIALNEAPARARVLSIGVGTGAEILALAKVEPEWSFVGVDPSVEMLEVCRARLAREGVLDRCELINGYIEDAPEGSSFDVALSILVAHFIGRKDRTAFYRGVHDRLKSGGWFVSTEICSDLVAPEFPALLKNWEQIQLLMGASAESLRQLPYVLRDVLSVLTPAQTELLWREAGFALPVQFFQAFMIRGWYAQRA